jgi:glycosyltransferase involved in cell wall biosynthesis
VYLCIKVSSVTILKRAVVSVINDLSTDVRVDKICRTLSKCGYNVTLVGRLKRDSRQLDKRDYKTHRMKLLFQKEAVFYAEYNFRLFLYLLFKKADLLYANDLDTLLPNYLVSKLKKIPLVYDSHEYFTGVPELENNNFARNCWIYIEKKIFPKLKHIFTVNDSIAGLYRKQYNKEVKVVRNVPLKTDFNREKNRIELGLPLEKNIIILQGAGINVDRGGEELIEAMNYIENTLLLIIGGGDVIDTLKTMTKKMGLNDRIVFINKLPYSELMQYTSNADLGLTLDKGTNINYRFSLPNKLFDYIMAGIPVLSSDLPEIRKIIEKYDIGEIIESHKPMDIAGKINQMLKDKEKLKKYTLNTSSALNELCWENEEVELINVFKLYA